MRIVFLGSVLNNKSNSLRILLTSRLETKCKQRKVSGEISFVDLYIQVLPKAPNDLKTALVRHFCFEL